MFQDLLNLESTVQVAREAVTPDGMGGSTTTTTLTTLDFAAIWQSGSFNKYLSERITRDSTHVLGVKPTSYTWNQNDRNVVYNGDTYKIVGRPDNIMAMDEVLVVPLELQT